MNAAQPGVLAPVAPLARYLLFNAVPSTPSAPWCWLREKDRGQFVQATRALERAPAPARALACEMRADY